MSGVIPVVPLINRSIRVRGTPRRRANAIAPISKGSRCAHVLGYQPIAKNKIRNQSFRKDRLQPPRDLLPVANYRLSIELESILSANTYVSLSRRFLDVSSSDFDSDADSIWATLSSKERGKTWEQILQNDVSVLLGTAGSGKTTEVRQQVRDLDKAGVNAFLLRLEALQDGSIDNAFDFDLEGQPEGFEKWKHTGKGGVLFLDALDEARLPTARNESALEKALSVISKEIGRRRSPLRLVVTSRPSEWLGDRDVRNLEHFIRRTRNVRKDGGAEPVSHRLFRMAPLTTTDIEGLAKSRYVEPKKFLDAVNANLSAGLIQQPLDAHLFLDVWKKAEDEGRSSNQIFKSRLQVMHDLVTWRLVGRSEGRDRVSIDLSRARRAAGKLAAFVVISGQQDLTARQLAPGEVSAAQILSDGETSWTANEIRELLACGLFQPSVGGRIRFAHRELRDFLAAEYFNESMRSRANSEKPISVLFAEGLGRRSIPQSTEHVMGWLSAFNVRAKEIVAKIRPALLIETGDPKALSLGDKELLLRNQAKLYDALRFRGEWFYHDDIKRFTHRGLSAVVGELLDKSSSPELTNFLIEVARFGGMKQLAAKLASYVTNPDIGYRTKGEACSALFEIDDTAQKTSVLAVALTAKCPDADDTDAAPDWNMFQLTALQYCFEEATLLDCVCLLARVQRERSNYSSATSQYLIETLDDLPVQEKRKWLEILLRFAFESRAEDRYRMPNASARYKRFVPAIIFLASELVSRDDTAPDDSDLLDAIEMALGKDRGIDIFGRKAPKKSLAEGLRSRPVVKHALIERRIDLFSDRKKPDRVPFGIIHPLEFDDEKENGDLFEKSDVLHYCKLAGEATGQDERAFLLDLANTIRTKLHGNEHNEAHTIYLKHLKKLGNAEQKRRFGIRGYFSRLMSRFQHQYRYDVQNWVRDRKERLKAWKAAGKNRCVFGRNKKEILSGNINENEAYWLFNRSPNNLGDGTINSLREGYGDEIAEMFKTGMREFWKTHDTCYADRRTYLGSVGLAGINLDHSLGELPTDAFLASKAFRFAFHELNSFPDWVETLAKEFPREFCSEMKRALIDDFNAQQAKGDHYSSDCISKIAHSSIHGRNLVAPMLLKMMMHSLPSNRRDRMLCLDIVARARNTELNRLSRFLVSGFRNAWTRFDFREAWVWLDALLSANSRAAGNILAQTFADLSGSGPKVLFFEFMGREGNKPALENDADLVRKEYERDPLILEWLVRAAYLAWPPEKDERHETTYSPGQKDHAESNRRGYVSMLGAIHTIEVQEAFRRLANLKELKDHKDTFLYQIELMSRAAGRRPELSPNEAVRFLNEHSKVPSSVEEFRELCSMHIGALLEKLHCSDDDESAFFRRGEAKEGDLRNWLAARLRDVGERYYTVIREQEVAGEKRPDLRIHSRIESLGNVSVEIKLADMDHWTGGQLVETSDDQLSKQYLLEPSSHTGIYVLVNAARPRKREVDKKGKTKRRAFRKNVAGTPLNFERLVEAVETKCTEVNDGLGGDKVVFLVARDISEKPSETV